MVIAQHIKKLGFHRWYERQLIEAHASLVTAFLCVIMVAVCVDQFRWQEGGVRPPMMLALGVAGILLCYKTVMFYFRVLFHAEHIAQQANCAQCGAYGALTIVAVSTGQSPTTDEEWMRTRCRKCAHEWTVYNGRS